MAVVCTKQTFYRYSGLSTDTKPTRNIEESSTFEETDTGRRFEYRGGVWLLVSDMPAFHPSDLDNTTATKYFGFVTSDGRWYIMKKDGGEIRYCFGRSGYVANWSNRLSLTYRYFDRLF